MSDDNTIRPALSDPDTCHEYDEDGNVSAPWVRWDLSWGCASTIGYEDGQLVALVSTSDEDKRTGITRRAVTREQVGNYARKLLELVGDPVLAAEEQLGDIRHALAGEGFCAPDTDEWVSLANIRARIQDLVERVKELEERAEQAGNPDIRDLAYRSMRQQRDQAVDRAEKAEADLLTERMTELKLVSDLRERVEKTQAERDQLIGFACDGSATCPSPLHVDGCFRSTEGGGDE